MTIDAVVHTWDLATAVGCEPVVDEGLASMAVERLRATEAAGAPLRQPIVMAEPVPDPVSGGVLERLIAYTGRDPTFGK